MRSVAVAVFLVGTSIALSSSAEEKVPSSMVMKVYRFGLSTSPLCENMTIYTVEAPEFVDLTTNPTLGSANVPHGTYNCVALEIDQVIKAAPRVAAGACTTEQQNLDMCQALELLHDAPPPPPPPPGTEVDGGAGGEPVEPAPLIDGVLPLGGDAGSVFKTCKPGGDRLAIYLTTQVPAGAMTNAFRPPTSTTDTRHGHPLGAPLVVGPSTTGTLIAAVNAVSTDSGTCYVDNPSFSFESSGN